MSLTFGIFFCKGFDHYHRLQTTLNHMYGKTTRIKDYRANSGEGNVAVEEKCLYISQFKIRKYPSSNTFELEKMLKSTDDAL